jgi:hypothetical protein
MKSGAKIESTWLLPFLIFPSVVAPPFNRPHSARLILMHRRQFVPRSAARIINRLFLMHAKSRTLVVIFPFSTDLRGSRFRFPRRFPRRFSRPRLRPLTPQEKKRREVMCLSGHDDGEERSCLFDDFDISKDGRAGGI